MKRRRPVTAVVAAGVMFGALLVAGMGVASGAEDEARAGPAPPAALQRIAARNERAAAQAAAEVRANAQENLQIADAEFARLN